MREFVESRLCGHLCKRIDSDLSAARVALNIAAKHFKRDCFNLQRAKCTLSIPCRYGGCLIGLAISLREHEPIPAEHESLERDFASSLVTICALLCDSALACHWHAELNCLLAFLHVAA